MSKHTPGPWQLFRDDEREMYDVCIPSTVGIRGIAEVSFGYSEPAETEQHANAKLIAAAPELLEALAALWTASVGTSDAEISARLKARFVIAKATGEGLPLRDLPVIGVLNVDNPSDPRNREWK